MSALLARRARHWAKIIQMPRELAARALLWSGFMS
jgi:hypothetical protein